MAKDREIHGTPSTDEEFPLSGRMDASIQCPRRPPHLSGFRYHNVRGGVVLLRVGFSILLCGNLALFTSDVLAGGKVGVYGIRMAPSGSDARTFSRAGWGGGIRFVVPIPQLDDIVAGTIGFEIVNLLDQTIEFRDQPQRQDRSDNSSASSAARF